MNSTFSISRFGLLIRKHLIEEYKLQLMSLLAFMGGLFVIFFLIHVFNGMTALSHDFIGNLYIVIFIVASSLYGGASYSSFRSKEQTMSYLLIPSTRLEKFIFEYVIRVLLFIVLTPIMYWLVANLELAFVSALYEKLDYTYQSIRLLPDLRSLHLPVHGIDLMSLIILIFFNIAFLGATHFMKHPMIKTLFSVAILWMFFVALIMFSAYLFDISRYSPIQDFQLTLMPTEFNWRQFFLRSLTVINLILIPICYLKLKEKEV